MRHLPGYRWEHILEERVSRTMVSLEMISKEQKAQQRDLERARRK